MDEFVCFGCAPALTVCGKLIVKARSPIHARVLGVRSGLAVVGSIFWTPGVEKSGLGFAPPVMALGFVLVAAVSHEAITAGPLFGLGLIVAGVPINALAR